MEKVNLTLTPGWFPSLNKNKQTQTISFAANGNTPEVTQKPSMNNLKAYYLNDLSFLGKILKHDQREWMEANGGGAYSSSTVSGANTRVYHGTLVAALNQPVERNVVLSRIDEEVETAGNKKTGLSDVVYGVSNAKLGGASGKEESNIKSFSVLPVPTWVYDLEEGKTLTKQIAMPQDKSRGTVVIGYTYNAPKDAPEIKLSIRPILNYRGFHNNQNSLSGWEQHQSGNNATYACSFPGSSYKGELFVSWDKQDANYHKTNNGYGNYFYQREADRGLGSKEHNLFSPGVFEVKLKPGESFSLTSSIERGTGPISIQKAVKEKEAYLEKLYKQSGLPRTEAFEMLQRAADQFVVHRNSVNGPTILAGYHWFNDWGRDTMISLPGCTLTTKRLDEAKGILTTFSKYARNGMLPNNFPDFEGADPGYNTIDASMWWFNALDSYIKAAGKDVDKAFVKEQYNALKKVVMHHIYGRHTTSELVAGNINLNCLLEPEHGRLPVGNGDKGIGMEPDCLIAADNGQLTWMDAAKDENHPFTPREGKCVEINALWYNGLRIMQELAEKFGEQKDAKLFKVIADNAKHSMQKFWNPETGCLHDLIDVHRGSYTTDGSIRPNQIIALSLPHRAFDDDPKKEQSILKVVQDKLLTPYGLRSLAPGHEKYAPYYPNSGPAERDPLYHQGTVWGWLIGPFADAYLNVKDGSKKKTREEVYNFIYPMIEHLKGNVKAHTESGSCIGGIAEIFDATEPFHSKGTVNQAWSVAEVLRIMDKIQDVALEAEKK